MIGEPKNARADWKWFDDKRGRISQGREVRNQDRRHLDENRKQGLAPSGFA